jgi:hypothetical protein
LFVCAEVEEVRAMSRAFTRYLELLDQLLWRRAVLGDLAEDEEERFANSLNECRSGMAAVEESQLSAIIAQRRAAADKLRPLDLVDVEPPATEGPLREKAA